VQTVDIIIRGFLTGLGVSLGLGAVFFALVQNSIKGGYKTGISIASGVIASDILFITFALLGTSFIGEGDLTNKWIQLIAISFLLGLGAYTFFHAKKPIDKSPGTPSISFGNVVFYFGKGFLLNALNPANFFAWAAISTITSGLGYTLSQNILFFSCALLGIFLMESLISIGAHKIKTRLTDNFILWMNRTVAILYIVVAIALIVNLFV
jgi:L-lysine exporter family protein LysE/ArgO